MIPWSRRKWARETGFTLIELLVVVVILGLLVAIAVPIYASITRSAQEKTFEANHRIAVSALHMWMTESGGDIPDQNEDFDSFIDGGLAGMANQPVAGAKYEWDGTTMESTATIGGDELTRTYTPSL